MKIRVLSAAALFALGAGAIAGGVLADARAARLQALLSEIETAEERIPHSGTRVLEGADWSVTLRVAAAGGRSRVEILDLSGGKKAPPRKGAAARVPFLASFPEFLKPGHGQWARKVKDYGLALRNYDVVPAGRATVAGREADLLEVLPRLGGRPGYRVAADAANRFPLRFEAVSGGRRVFSAEFREIDYSAALPAGSPGPRRPPWLKIDREEVPFGEVPARVDYGIWSPARLPAGFERRRSALVRVRVDLPEEVRRGMERLPFPLPRIDARVAHFDYTDGIAVLSVVECPARSELWKLVRGLLGAGADGGAGSAVVVRRFADAGGSAFFLETGDTAILAAGNVDAGEIEKMIRTLRRR